MNSNELEIERKFLIAYPSNDVLERCEMTEITQTYLDNPERGVTERVRRRGANGVFMYTHTKKTRISAISRVEKEREISREEYAELLLRADKSRKPVSKKRYCLSFQGQMFEIDVYPFWQDRAIMELELEDENQIIAFPPQIKIIREVTQDGRYTNASMAKGVPQD